MLISPVEIWYFNDGYFGFWLICVSVLLERQLRIQEYFHRDYDDFGSFPMKWTHG